MIAYNFNIDFSQEQTLQDGVENSLLETIYVVQIQKDIDFHQFRYCSPYEDEAFQQIRYCAESEFSQCLDNGSTWIFEVKGVVTFIWRMGDHTVNYKIDEFYSPEDLHFWFLASVLPMMLTLEKKYDILHVAAVEIEGKCILFSGRSLSGKSTMTEHFLKKGHALLSDDSLAVYKQENTFYGLSSHPYCRPYRMPDHLGYPAKNIADRAKPIQAIFLLKKTSPTVPVRIIELEGDERLKAFDFQYSIKFDFFKEYRANQLAEMIKTIPVYRVLVPWNVKRLEEVRQAILAKSS